FTLPPIEEQRRMAAAFQACERVSDSLRALCFRLYKVRLAHLNDFFKPRYESGRSLSEVATILSGGTPSKSNRAYWGGTRLWASGKDLKTRRLDDTELHLTDEGWTVAKVAPEKATLIVVRGMILAHTFPVSWCRKPTAINQDLRAL